MALVIEDGAPTEGNSFIDVNFLDDYLADRAYSIGSDKEAWLIKSYDFMSSLNWKVSHEEAFQVTAKMKKAQAEIAYRMSQGVDVFSADEPQIKKEKVDVLETEYFESSSMNAIERFPQALAYISDLINGSASDIGSTVGNIELVR